MAVDRLILDRLMFTKYVVASARRELASGTDHGAWIAVLQFHDAAETFLLCVIDHLGIPRKFIPLAQYGTLIDADRKARNKRGQHGYELLRSQVLRDLTGVRDHTKHSGIYPRRQHVREISAHLDQFLETNAQQFFGMSFDRLSLATMIKDRRIRAEVEAAEVFLTESKYSEAITALGTAFKVLMSLEQERFRPIGLGRGEPLPRELLDVRALIKLIPNSPATSEVRRHLDATNSTWELAVERLEVVALGLNPLQYATFIAILPSIHLTHGGRALAYQRSDAPLVHTRENAEFGLEFVLEAIGRAQSAPRVLGAGATRTIRAKHDTTFVQYPDLTSPAGHIPRGTEIDRATYGLGPPSFAGDPAWSWTPSGEDMRIARFSDFEIVDEPRRAGTPNDEA